jgi:osmotically-inducible protein OsmY
MKTDLDIQQDVMAELLWEPGLRVAEIGASVKNGVVILSGIVDSYYKKVLAEKAAKKVAGVKAVAEEIEVRVPGSRKVSDLDIAEAVINSLKWNSTVVEEAINVKVEKGAVTLEGEAEWNFQKESAQKAVENLVGITSIINNIRVINKVSMEDLQEKIDEAFVRSATLDADKIRIDVNGDKVVLSGRVRSFAEKKDAERTVWASPGVMHVINNLEVDSQVVIF